MSPNRRAPLFIRLCSYFFMFMGAVAIGTMGVCLVFPEASNRISISFISNRVTFQDDPIAFSVLSVLFILAGIVGASILFRIRRAYDVGIAFCVISAATLGIMTVMKIGVINSPLASFPLILAIFAGFAFYLLRNRKKWNEC